jgi:predicted  nucleic acid-binding Zn-ribbon protein
MLEAIEKLLILQERDRQLSQLEAELAFIPPQKDTKQRKAAEAQANAEARKKAAMQLESRRKELEVEVESLQENIQRYSLQQYQTKKNDEYQALAKEINAAKARIAGLEDQQLDLMEEGEVAQKTAAQAAAEAKESQEQVERELADLDTREANLRQRQAELSEGRENLAQAVDESVLARYERLRKTKDRVLVGIDRGICGGCHMALQPHLILACRAAREVVTCSNCSRILYYERGMEV